MSNYRTVDSHESLSNSYVEAREARDRHKKRLLPVKTEQKISKCLKTWHSFKKLRLTDSDLQKLLPEHIVQDHVKVPEVAIVDNFDKFVNSRHAKYKPEQIKDTRMLRGEYNQTTTEKPRRYNSFELRNVRQSTLLWHELPQREIIETADYGHLHVQPNSENTVQLLPKKLQKLRNEY